MKVDGLRALEEELFKLKASTAKSNVRASMKKALEPMMAEAQRDAPVADGKLKESFNITSRVAPRQGKISDLEMYMGPGRHPQAITQEFGTRFHPAQPFMRPAWDGGKEKLLTDFGDMLWERVNKAVARAARKAAKG